MSNNWELMFMYSDKELDMKRGLMVEKMIHENKDMKEAYFLNKQIDECMRLQLMMEQIKSDPYLEKLDLPAKSDVLESFGHSDDSNNALSFYINSSLADVKTIKNMVDEAEYEMYHHGIDQETEEWVRIWKEENGSLGQKDKKTIEIENFIRQGMKISKPPATISGMLNRKYRIIAFRISTAAAILILTFGIWALLNSKSSTDHLFAAYYKTYTVIDGQTRGNDQFDMEMKEIVRLYKIGQFDEVSIKLVPFLIEETPPSKVLLMNGISQIELREYEKAIASFNKVINQGGEFILEAKWYLALCYIKMKNIPEAKKILAELSQTPGIYKSMAQELMDKL